MCWVILHAWEISLFVKNVVKNKKINFYLSDSESLSEELEELLVDEDEPFFRPTLADFDDLSLSASLSSELNTSEGYK